MKQFTLVGSMFALVTAVSLAGFTPGFTLPVYGIDDDDPMTAPDGSATAPPTDAPKGKRPPRGDGNGGVLSGPKVPANAGDGNSSFGAADGKKGDRQQMQGGMMEMRLFSDAIKSIEQMLTEDQHTKIAALRESFQKEVTTWREVNGEKLKAMEGKMRGARGVDGQGAPPADGKGGKGGKPAGGPDGGVGGPPNGGVGGNPKGGPDGAQGERPDKATMQEMQKLRATMPKFDTVRDQIMAVLTPDQQAEVKSTVAAERKRMEKQRGGQGGKGGPDGKRGGGGDGGEKAAPPMDPPKEDYKFPN